MKHLLFIAAFTMLFISSCKKSDTPQPQPVPVTQKNIATIDNAVSSFMNTFSIPGISIAVTKDDKLVYVKSYGQMSATDNTPVANSSLFRIASLSKSITGVGIMKLLEANSLTLDSKVFGPGSILGSDFPSSQLSTVSDVTIRHLLHHTTNAWPNNGTDPMFQQTSMNQSQLISWTLDNYSAATTRGVYNYSNFGYCVLGRVIEKLSGKTYEQFIKDAVLTPSGITAMQMGGNTLADRKPNEVLYNGQNGNNPYIYNVSRMDAHGGWLASATDLAKFMVRVNGFSGKPDILQASTITIMTTRSVPVSNYACGWNVNNNNNWWHNGSLPGTATQMIRANNGFCWVVLCNSRSNASAFSGALDNLLWPVINDATTPWQDIDQF
jgi:D-alanyl-D-alanine carboxypeptidase